MSGNTPFLGGSSAGMFGPGGGATPIFNPAPYTADPAPVFTPTGPASPASSVVTAPPPFTPPKAANINIGDYQNDPVLGSVRAMVKSQSDQAAAQALANKKAQLARFGDPALASAMLGADAAGIGYDPFSTTADLNTWNARSLTGVDETRNQQNLFYSTARARDRSLQEESMLRAKAKATSQLQDVINQISQDVVNVKNSGLQQIAAAEEGSYNRAVSLAMARAQLGITGDTGGSSGGGGGGSGVGPGGGASAKGPDHVATPHGATDPNAATGHVATPHYADPNAPVAIAHVATPHGAPAPVVAAPHVATPHYAAPVPVVLPPPPPVKKVKGK